MAPSPFGAWQPAAPNHSSGAASHAVRHVRLPFVVRASHLPAFRASACRPCPARVWCSRIDGENPAPVAQLRSIWAAVAVTALLGLALVVNARLTATSVRRVANTGSLVSHTQEVLESLQSVWRWRGSSLPTCRARRRCTERTRGSASAWHSRRTSSSYTAEPPGCRAMGRGRAPSSSWPSRS